MSRKRNLSLGIVVAAGLLAAGGWLAAPHFGGAPPSTGTGELSPAPDEQRTAGAAADGIAARRTDPANRLPLEHATDPSRLDELRTLTETAHDRLDDLKNGETQWMGFVTSMTFGEDKLAAQTDCIHAHLSAPCSYELSMVVEQTGPGKGSVVYANGGVNPDLKEGADGCRDYVACLARSRMGQEVDMPEDAPDLVAHRRRQTDNYDENSMKDPEQVERTLQILEGALEEMMEEGPTDDPMWPYYLAMQKARVAEFTRALAELKG